MIQPILIVRILQKEPFAEKVLRNKAFNTAKDPKYDGYQRGLASKVYNFSYKKSALLADKPTKGSGVSNLQINLCLKISN